MSSLFLRMAFLAVGLISWGLLALPATAADSAAAEALVQQALRAEFSGGYGDREELLAEALQRDPDCDLAQSHRGGPGGHDHLDTGRAA